MGAHSGLLPRACSSLGRTLSSAGTWMHVGCFLAANRTGEADRRSLACPPPCPCRYMGATHVVAYDAGGLGRRALGQLAEYIRSGFWR